MQFGVNLGSEVPALDPNKAVYAAFRSGKGPWFCTLGATRRVI